MIEGKATVLNKVGLHARPASVFVRTASKYESSVVIESAGKKADGKSILQVLALGVGHGYEVIIRADGVDEKAALEELLSVLNSNLGES